MVDLALIQLKDLLEISQNCCHIFRKIFSNEFCHNFDYLHYLWKWKIYILDRLKKLVHLKSHLYLFRNVLLPSPFLLDRRTWTSICTPRMSFNLRIKKISELLLNISLASTTPWLVSTSRHQDQYFHTCSISICQQVLKWI